MYKRQAYVNRVLAGLDHAVGDVTRIVVTDRTIPPHAIDRLKEIYLDNELLQLVVDVYQEDLFRNLAGIRPNPGDKKTTVVELITVTPRCVFAKVRTDASEVALTADAIYEQWVGITPIEGRDTPRSNLTSWGFVYEGFAPDLSAPLDPCVDF